MTCRVGSLCDRPQCRKPNIEASWWIGLLAIAGDLNLGRPKAIGLLMARSRKRPVNDGLLPCPGSGILSTPAQSAPWATNRKCPTRARTAARPSQRRTTEQRLGHKTGGWAGQLLVLIAAARIRGSKRTGSGPLAGVLKR